MTTDNHISNTNSSQHEETKQDISQPKNHDSQDTEKQNRATTEVKQQKPQVETHKHKKIKTSSSQKSEEDDKREQLLNSIKSIFSAKTNKNSTQDKIKSKEKNEQKTASKEEEIVEKIKPYIPYAILAFIIYIGTYIRIQSLGNLKDTVTGKWIPLALDPHLFYRYAHYIHENGKLFLRDTGRFIPEGISTVEYIFKTNFMVFLNKIVTIFAPNQGLDFTIVVYPVIAFAIAMIFFYLLVNEIFENKVTALLATLLLSIIPAFIQRTVAGFSDHEALGIMFFFLAMWLFIKTIKLAKDTKLPKRLGFFLATGIATGLMGQSWGGWKFLILIISGYYLVEFFLGNTTKEDVYGYLTWIISTVIVVSFWIPVYSISELLSSFTTGLAFLTLAVLLIDLAFKTKKLESIIKPLESKLPRSVIIVLGAIIVGILVLAITGNLADITAKLNEIWQGLLRPLGKNRWELTVAEQHQPYFTQWMSQFGPNIFGLRALPGYLILFMLGSVFAFQKIVQKFKQKTALTVAYVAFIIAFTMSRFSDSARFNGTNNLSIATYIGSLLIFGAIIAGYYLYTFYKDKKTHESFKSIPKEFVVLIIWFILMVVGARGAIRLFFMFAPVTAVLAAYATVELWNKAKTIKNVYYKAIAIAVLIFVIASPLASPMNGIIPTFYKQSFGQAQGSGPGYNFQWQQAGEWVRDNIQEDAVFAHWWDYGYWVQTGWERNTILDGTNKITYWNYLMGRLVMTGQNQEEALEWLKVHQATHFLIVPDEIGKYTAYSSIGSDENYDRYSYIQTFQMDQSLTRETRDQTVFAYAGSYPFDQDIIYEGQLFPQGASGIGALTLPIANNGQVEGDLAQVQINQPQAIVVNNGQQQEIPVECLYINGQMNFYPNAGLKGCMVIIPTIASDGSGQEMGAALYVSEKGMNALWTNLFLFEGKNPNYDTSAFVKVFDQTEIYAPLAYYKDHGRIIGPIKIWEIQYPEGFTVDPATEELYLGGNENLPDFFFDVS